MVQSGIVGMVSCLLKRNFLTAPVSQLFQFQLKIPFVTTSTDLPYYLPTHL